MIVYVLKELVYLTRGWPAPIPSRLVLGQASGVG